MREALLVLLSLLLLLLLQPCWLEVRRRRGETVAAHSTAFALAAALSVSAVLAQSAEFAAVLAAAAVFGAAVWRSQQLRLCLVAAEQAPLVWVLRGRERQGGCEDPREMMVGLQGGRKGTEWGVC